MGHLCLVLDLSRKTEFLTIKYNVNCMLFVDSLYQVEEVALHPYFMSIFIINRYWNLLDAFLHLLIQLCVCSFLASWCDGLRLLIFKCFAQNFYIYVHKRYCFAVFFFWNVLVWFCYEDNVGFIKWVGKYSLCF